ncbi:hypothetical protein [Amycolatopsis magusensis]|uniref:Uncharacterized protein n=1 Tax=Amycolatopsis magusensis TaxID=882444 RepID=A0ABS4PS19_9PSEU|nr:hypothetical protein [Amycolatopsis magusensis]MBP2182219.1 hypothetical protein [Amycolatopsis magusensis]MDI5974629.1 hypothetical protein [Amycolatopsis magusensis]
MDETPRDDDEELQEDAASRTAMSEDDTGPPHEPEAQPGRSAVSDRPEKAQPTGNVGLSDYPPTGPGGD